MAEGRDGESCDGTKVFEEDPGRIRALVEDQTRRFRRGESASVEEYFLEHPELATSHDLRLQLVMNEYVLRQQRGDPVLPSEYQARFPDLSMAIARRLAPAVPGGGQAVDPPTLVAPDGEAHDPPTRSTKVQPGSEADRPPQAPPSRPAVEDWGWPSLDGYEVQGVIGQGGMGVVYRARDLRRGVTVAVKTMRHSDALAIQRFKQEFRALLDVSHPNLITLHELISDGRSWFIVMEFVEGVHFLDAIQGPSNGETAPDCPATLSREGQARLRAALRQLVGALTALHRAGKLHRDIKPSNVLVTPEGRVVLMDFGLATSWDETETNAVTTGDQVIGTAAYMAPEQAANERLTSSSDWYSVGVMVYEALTGERPFVGHPLQILMAKQSAIPIPPNGRVTGIDDDLNSLCVDLLRRDPGQRPDGQQVLDRLGLEEPVAPRLEPSSSSGHGIDSTFVGRDAELGRLAGTLRDVERGSQRITFVQGRSGLGKSALVQRFLEGLSERGDLIVLKGRCYERESVPYKALDGVIDCLARYLRHLPPGEAEASLPRDVGPLAQVFPVLRRVGAVVASPRRVAEIPDPQELRRRAYAALRELLARLGDRRALILAIDDLQWGDPDSLAVLAEIVRPPDAPLLMLVGCYRCEDIGKCAFLDALRAMPGEFGLAADEIALEPLSQSDAQRLAQHLLKSRSKVPDMQTAMVALESEGNPLFVTELARSVSLDEDYQQNKIRREAKITLDEVLWERILRLPGDARTFLEYLSVAGGPLRPSVAWQCLDGDGDERSMLASLRVGRLLRGTSGRGEGEWVETYHDRIRETVVAHLDPEVLRQRHRRLAQTLEASGEADHETLGTHFLGAGEPARASEHFARAADEAAEALAFGRAASLYRQAIETAPASTESIGAYLSKLAESLANDGRGADAARAYLRASDGVTRADALELRRRAAMQFLISGHIEQGLAALRDVLGSIGMSLPATPRRSLASLLLRRTLLWIRGLRFRRKDPSEIAPADLRKIDVCWSAGIGLSNVDWIRGADFQARGLLLALKVGEPSRIARALAVEAAQSSTAGRPAQRRTARILRRAEMLSGELGDPYCGGMVELAKGVSSYLEGRWRSALVTCDRAEAIFRDRCTGVAWELDTAHAYALWALSHLGEWAELARRLPILIAEAKERGDLYAAMNLSTYTLSVVRLAADEPELAREELQRISSQWTGEGYHVQHNDQVWAMVQVALYRGDAADAWARLDRHWPTLCRSLLMRVQFIRVAMLGLRGRAALAASGGAGPLRRDVARAIRRLERERIPWAVGQARMLRAGLRTSDRRPGQAAEDLTQAAAIFRSCEMGLCAAVADLKRGLLIGGEEGERLVESADAWMRAQAVRNPDRTAALFAPGISG